jgi:hypothetical protein
LTHGHRRKRPCDILAKAKWKERWEEWVGRKTRNAPTFKEYVGPPSKKEGRKRRKKEKARGPKCHSFYNGMTRGEASLAITIRTEKIGFNAYLVMRRVLGYTPGYNLPNYEHTSQTAKHIIMYYPSLEDKRRGEGGLIQKCKTDNYGEMTSKRWKIKEASRWLINTDLLKQYILAKEMRGILSEREDEYLTEAERGGMIIAE